MINIRWEMLRCVDIYQIANVSIICYFVVFNQIKAISKHTIASGIKIHCKLFIILFIMFLYLHEIWATWLNEEWNIVNYLKIMNLSSWQRHQDLVIIEWNECHWSYFAHFSFIRREAIMKNCIQYICIYIIDVTNCHGIN